MSTQTKSHILFLVSSPLAADPVAMDTALTRLTDALRTVQAPATFVTRVAEVNAVSALLARRDRPRFAVLHYLGHGYKPEDVSQGYLIFEDQSGGVRPPGPATGVHRPQSDTRAGTGISGGRGHGLPF